MIEIYYKVYKRLLKITIDNQNKPKNKGAVPVTSAIINKETMKFFVANNSKITNGKNNFVFPEKLKRLTHAEKIVIQLAMLSEGSMNLSNWILITVARPCKHCLKAIKFSKIKSVYFLYKDGFREGHKANLYKDINYIHHFTRDMAIEMFECYESMESIRKGYNILISGWRSYLYSINK